MEHLRRMYRTLMSFAVILQVDFRLVDKYCCPLLSPVDYDKASPYPHFYSTLPKMMFPGKS